jgi:hypothetical protein
MHHLYCVSHGGSVPGMDHSQISLTGMLWLLSATSDSLYHRDRRARRGRTRRSATQVQARGSVAPDPPCLACGLYLLQNSCRGSLWPETSSCYWGDGPTRYYIFCVVQRARPSRVKLLSAISAVSGKSSNPYFFACLLKICNGPQIALRIRSACELRMQGARAKRFGRTSPLWNCSP